MGEYRSRRRERRSIAALPGDSEAQYLLNAEENILQSISARASVPEVLNEICTALDCQIGNISSCISLPEDYMKSAAEIARNAALFGLHTFFSASILAESGEELGSLEIYSCARRNAWADEIRSIERAACLAAIAIERDIQEGQKRSWCSPEGATC